VVGAEDVFGPETLRTVVVVLVMRAVRMGGLGGLLHDFSGRAVPSGAAKLDEITSWENFGQQS
jgi:hypothetical protein